MATRRTMDEAYKGGRVNPDPPTPERRRYPCFADGCPMPGTMFPNGPDKDGCCIYHYGAQPSDIPKVTQRLTDWQCVIAEINAARRVLTGDTAADPKAQDEAQTAAWQRLAPLVELSGWADTLKPQPREGYGDWERRLEAFMGARVVEGLSTHRRSGA